MINLKVFLWTMEVLHQAMIYDVSICLTMLVWALPQCIYMYIASVGVF